ncbi:hypothetical protein T4C_5116 [Trichinella pseudospiralis]|uniref:Secreted protein n=1 Tax=Trichinella pseudospiralis TaxID=6337 RepID=A0A0V1K3E3_TRIPS|nr:hypothetical protein T4C_5116 [Trichinella pseudospiralis]
MITKRLASCGLAQSATIFLLSGLVTRASSGESAMFMLEVTVLQNPLTKPDHSTKVGLHGADPRHSRG